MVAIFSDLKTQQREEITITVTNHRISKNSVLVCTGCWRLEERKTKEKTPTNGNALLILKPHKDQVTNSFSVLGEHYDNIWSMLQIDSEMSLFSQLSLYT